MASRASIEELCAALKVAVATLREAEIDFLLGGSLSLWARGGPEPYKDLDVMVRPADAERTLVALAEAGMRVERPPEEWLYKAYHGDVLIDVIFRPSGLELDDAVFARGDDISILSVSTPVMTLGDVLTTKLLAMDEHSVDYRSLLAAARSLREQIEWPALRQGTAHSPFARAFFVLAEGLEIAPPAQNVPGAVPGAGSGDHNEATRPRVRVLRD